MATNRPKVVLTEHLDDEAACWLADRVHLVRQPHTDPDALKRELADAQGLVVRTYTRVDESLLAAAPKLRIVGRAGVGLDNIDLEACRRGGVRVVYTPEANTQAVVEYIWALILDAVRPRAYLDRPVDPAAFHEHRRRLVGRQLDRMTLGVLGMGRIGRRVARVADAIGLRVICNDLLSPADLALPQGQPGRFVEKPELWAGSNILTIHIDGRAANRNLLNAETLARLKPSCLLINTSRGMVIDPVALAEWARQSRQAGGAAVLDVHEPEPPPPDYPLWGLDNVRILPHLGSRTHEAMSDMSWVVRDIVMFFSGREPRWAAV